MSQDSLTVYAPAKVNLSLKILGRRDDGYHLLDTHMQKLALFDTLSLSRVESGIHLQCPGGQLPEGEDNLVYKAAALFLAWVAEHRGVSAGVALTLVKNIPIAAGLGGGSSDAAATLLGLNDMLKAGCPEEELLRLGLLLGADVPFFIQQAQAVRAKGVGEEMVPVASLHDCWILLVNPGFSVSTRWVYQNFALTENDESVTLQNSRNAVGGKYDTDLSLLLVNDLERVTLKKYPELERIKHEMLALGADGSLMSGSGPTLFGIFKDQQRAQGALSLFQEQFSQVFLVEPLQ
nr:4-(cytidine 5'-diphospho)-2-C-methyl-D-erythritol kinase [uncultured Desulfobulbus sp.]